MVLGKLFLSGIALIFFAASPSVAGPKAALDSRLAEAICNPTIKQRYRTGLAEAEKLRAFARELRTRNLDPVKDHVPEFVALATEHLDFLKRHAYPTDSMTRKIQELTRDIARRTQEKEMTYEWWLHFNARLSGLLTHETDIGPFKTAITAKELRHFSLRAFVESFPDSIYLPTTSGALELSTFNRIGIEGIFPVGLIGSTIKADGIRMSPLYFFDHDLSHAFSIRQTLAVWKRDGLFPKLEKFHAKFLKKVESLSPRDQHRLEMVYFYISHENLKLLGKWLEKGSRGISKEISEGMLFSLRSGSENVRVPWAKAGKTQALEIEDSVALAVRLLK